MALPLLTTLLQAVPTVTATISATASTSGTVTPTIQIDAAQLPHIPSTYLITDVIGIVIMLVVAIGIPFLLVRRFGMPFRYLLWGALVGFGVQSVLVPTIFQLVASGLGVPSNPDELTSLGLSLLGSAIAGIVATAGFFAVYQFVLKYDEERTWSSAMMVGAGATTVLIVMNGLLSQLIGLASVFSWPPSAETIAQLDDKNRQAVLDSATVVRGLSGFEPLTNLLFSLAPAVIELLAAVLVYKYIRSRNISWLVASFALFVVTYSMISVINYFLRPALGDLGVTVTWCVIYALIAVGVIVASLMLYEPPHAPAPIVAGPVVTKAEDQVMADHPELEEPKVTRRKRRR